MEIKIKPLNLINDLVQLKIKMREYIISTVYHTPIILTFTSPMVTQFNGGNLKFPILKSPMTIVERMLRRWFPNQAYGIVTISCCQHKSAYLHQHNNTC